MASSSSSSSLAFAESYLKLRTVAISLIDQAIDLLENVVTSDARLTVVSELVPASTIGKHLRHLHDHFRILFESALAESDHKTLNYDARERNVPMESSHEVILQEFIELKLRYLQDPLSRLNRTAETSDDGMQSRRDDPVCRPRPSSSSAAASFDHNQEMELVAITPFRVCLQTTFNRELWFACLHATHHYALIRVIVTGELKLELPKEFGVAPSTLERSKI